MLHEAGVSVYIQNLGIYTLQPNGEPNPIASIMVTVLAEMANIERSNIVYRLNSGRDSYIANGGKLGRRKGSCKTTERKKEEYKEVISLLKRGYSVRNTAKLCFTNPLPLCKVNTFPLHSLNRGFQALATAQYKE